MSDSLSRREFLGRGALLYGGNRDYAGWKLLGFPGPRHEFGGYTPGQMLGTEEIETVWGGKV